MPVGAAVAVVGAASAANQQRQAKKAAGQLGAGAQAGFDQYEEYNRPYYAAGTSALSRLERLNAGDFSDFTASPDYQFALEQGQEGLNRAAASRGALNSGGQDVDLLKFGQGLASQNYGQYYSRLADLARQGQQSAQGIGGQAVQAQNTIGGANAEGTIGGANAWSNYASSLGGLAGQYQGMGGFGAGRQSSFQQPTGGAGGAYNFGNNQSNFQGQYNPFTGGYGS